MRTDGGNQEKKKAAGGRQTGKERAKGSRQTEPGRAAEKAKSAVNLRELALEALLSIEKDGMYSHLVIGGILDKYNYLEAQEKAFFKRLVEGTLERRIEIDYCLASFSKTPITKMKPLIRELLRMSVYQLLFMDGVPDSAVCNEAVKLAERHSFHSLKGFVNGVLRSACRNKETIAYPDKEKDRVRYLSVRWSMPEWLIEKWDAEQGCGRTEAILKGLLEEKPVTVRLKHGMSRAQQEQIRHELEAQGIVVTQDAYLPYAWHLEKCEGMKNISAFADGKLTVQDVSSMLAIEAAGIRQGDFVIDTCAAPGGKMLFAAEKAREGGRVLARDVSEYKLSLMEENRRRMKADNVALQQWDAAVCDQGMTGRADVVLVDAPCSGYGVIGKKRDIKYRATPEGGESLRLIQQAILTASWQYVKPGGVLLYSTCTISRAENEEMAEWFTQRFPFHTESLRAYLPEELGKEVGESGCFQFLPGVHGTDGFFIARFVRNTGKETGC